jgi:hypothetical protein
VSLIDFWQPQATPFDTYDLSGATAFDLVSLSGSALPGICKVDVEKARKLDIKQNAGSHGATITDQGYKPAKVTITQTIWSPTQWANLQALWTALEPIPGTSYAAPSVTITHPAAQLHGVDSIIIEEITGPKPSTMFKGALEIVYKCVQFFPPPKLPATNTPKGSVAAPKGANDLAAKPPDPSKNPLPAAPIAP